ncbi:MAG: dephospho-CoA kinase [Planctomycetota bacterium]|nr:dephospho-CoA kinase [Planctomycetota bacterium]
MGLVGGIGSGKSTIARRASERFGFALIDGDAAGHRALTMNDVRNQLKERFGDGIFSTDGSVERSALARRVFGASAEHAAAKADLERITHPVIRQEFREKIASATASGAPAVLLDAAVLFEAGWQEFCDGVVYVDAPDEVRHSRIAERGWTAADWRRREASQMSLDEKRRRANMVISNAASLDEAVDALVAAVGEMCDRSFVESTSVAGSTV